MKLYEEFKEYENLWESTEKTALIFATNHYSYLVLQDIAEKDGFNNITVTAGLHDTFTEWRRLNPEYSKAFVKIYTDTKGKEELEAACVSMPADMKAPILSAITLIEGGEAEFEKEFKKLVTITDDFKNASARVSESVNDPEESLKETTTGNNYKYYYVICVLEDFGTISEVLAAGVRRVDIDWCAKRGYDPAEEAMTDFWDATEIPYSDSWDDDMYDSLMRYVYEIDETTYNTKAGLPKTDAEIIKYVEDSTVDNINLAEDTASMLQETGTQVIDWENRENWRARIAPEVVYALMAIAVGPVARDVFINWDLEGIDGYFAAVDDLKDIDVYSFYETALEAEEYANAAYNHGTCGGWRGPISIIKITNFRNAYYKSGISPEYSIVKTI